MTLAAGTWLGSYEVLSHLGSGGMGEVYRARDSKLQREVALKVLPKAFAHDPERLARFRREAQLLASLNHPSIAAIYGLEESGGTNFLVLELVLGDTLRERIKPGPLPIEEALTIGKQIAEALEAAHEKAIIHRDLKPANAKVTPEGKVKVLDFGLAKAFAGEAPGGDPGDSPTLSAMTVPGTILGTAAYMSPEQARGKKVDKRTDIWAFGCVLYELLTGKQAFPGEDVTDILASVVKSEPDWAALPPATPANIRLMLRRCLQKDRTQRLHAAGDARLEIEQAIREPEWVQASRPVQRQARMPVLLASAVSLMVGAVIASAVWNYMHPKTPIAPSAKRFVLTLPQTDRINANGLALSPDGKNLVYVGTRGSVSQLYRRSMDQLEAVPIPGTEGADVPFFSPDGQWLGFFTADKLKKVALAGGPPATLCSVPAQRRGASWGRDDTIIFGSSSSGLLRVPAAGGTPQPVTKVEANQGGTGHSWPDILPNGKAVLFTVWPGTLQTARIAMQDFKTGQQRILLEGTHPRFLPTGHIVFARPGSLWAVPFDPDRLEMTGSPVPLLEGIQVNSPIGLANFATAEDGSLVYLAGIAAAERRLVLVDRKGAVEPLGAPPRPYEMPRLSPDGRRVAVRTTEENLDIWVYELGRQTLTRLTFDPGLDEAPAWTPDGKWIAFGSDRPGGSALLRKPADGSGAEEQLAKLQQHSHAASWTPDGKVLAFEMGGAGNRDIWFLPSEGDRKPLPFLRTQFSESAAKFSPDGHWIAYMSNESGRVEVYVQPYPGPGGKWQISTGGGTEPTWARNGRELFYRNGDKMMVVDVTTQPTFSAGSPKVLFEGQYERNGSEIANYDVTPDGQRFLMIQPIERESGLSQIQVVLNWFEELKRKVPVKQ